MSGQPGGRRSQRSTFQSPPLDPSEAREKRGPMKGRAFRTGILVQDPRSYWLVTEVESVMLVSDPPERGWTLPVTVNPSMWAKRSTGP